MLLNLLILLLLSNSVTSRRDKSILYSRVNIILLISAFIVYDNLSLLFLAEGIGIFGGLFHTTATTNPPHILIFLISVVILLTTFYPKKVWLIKYCSPNRIIFTTVIYFGTVLLFAISDLMGIPAGFLTILFILTERIFKGLIFLIYHANITSKLHFICFRNPDIKPHSFTSTPLQSTSNIDKSAIIDLLNLTKEKKREVSEAKEALITLQKAIQLDRVLPDKSKNASMREIKEYYSHYFDEESGNTSTEGLKQLWSELHDEHKYKKAEYAEALKKLSDAQNPDLNEISKSTYSNILPINYIKCIPMNIEIFISLFRCVFPLIGICIALDLFSIKITDILDLDIDFSSSTRFIIFCLSCFSLFKKVRFYLILFRTILNFFKGKFILSISIITIVITLFIFMPEELLSLANILALILFNS